MLLTRETRCHCGQLLALLLADGIEIKCKRCKRLETISFKQILDFIKGKEPQSSDPCMTPAGPSRTERPGSACRLHKTRKDIV